jgi:hypothetical protein
MTFFTDFSANFRCYLLHMRSLLVIAIFFASVSAFAQSGAGSQDSSALHLRPNSFGAYVVGCFPSPAFAGQPITVQTYNRNSVEISVTVYDGAGREMLDLLPKQTLPGGLHTFTIPPNLSAGVYHVRLIAYTASDAPDIVDDARFIIVH